MSKLAAALTCALIAVSAASGAQVTPRNVLIFVADGLRPGSVNPVDAPTISALRDQGVNFVDSHALFPTFTTPNAAAIATGHYPGDTGDFSNSLYIGYRTFNSGNFGKLPASSTPFIEDDLVLGDLDDHFKGNYLGEDTLLAIARTHGYSTAAIGKLGATAIQDITQLEPKYKRFATPQTVIIDDATGAAGVPLDTEVTAGLLRAGLPLVTPVRIQPAGDEHVTGSRNPNWGQQLYFVEAATRVVLPLFKQRGRPFVLLYWSRDPDGTQHNEGDSLNRLMPGINGPTSRAAVRNADDNLRQLLDYLRTDPELAANTDIVVTSDHGFATISKHDIDAQHHGTASVAARAAYRDVPAGFLPPGFLAIDLAAGLQEPLYDPDSLTQDAHGNPIYQRVVLPAALAAAPAATIPSAVGSSTSLQRAHPRLGHGLIGGSGRPLDRPDADVIVAANGGSDLIYLPHGDAALARRLVALLSGFDYVGALFVDDVYGPIPGALPLSSIDLTGSARLPRPSIVVAFRTFELDPHQTGVGNPLLNAVEIADTAAQQGQGMHGSFGRDNTFNVMIAAGPDFKRRYRDAAPASNADITPTLLHALDLPWHEGGQLTGRVLAEALSGGATAVAAQRCTAMSAPAPDGRRTILAYQRAQGRLYLDQAWFRATRVHEQPGCQPSK